MSAPFSESGFPIGVFDSGVGGLSVLCAIRELLPREDLIFIADQAHVPYGPRPIAQVREYAEAITRYLIARGAKLIVVACNTASAAALHGLRERYPNIPFVGMEPAVKPAAESTQSGAVGVLATPATFHGELYASVVARFARGITVLQDTCPGLVGQIEKGALDSAETRAILLGALAPMLEQGIDRVVLGCTHYPFVIPLIQEIVPPQVQVIDPAIAVARQTSRVLEASGNLAGTALTGAVEYLTSGDPESLGSLLPKLIGESGTVQALSWRGLELEPVE